ncbi:MAG: hypothetical protein RL338_769 [Chloroflexota bacterium]|jgi:hypothetical protein
MPERIATARRVTRSAFVALAVVSLLGSSAPPVAASDASNAFIAIRATTVWPVAGGTRDAITSTFGPRIKVSSGGYDWHRGIDLHAVEGTPIVAPTDGTLFGIRDYPDGGLTVILRHRFASPTLFKGKLLTDYYTFYMHLSAIAPDLVAAAASGATPDVPRGTTIGAAGHTGSAVDDHLHLELRLGTPYSLEWQLANPTSRYGANAFGFDPHVHPLLLFAPSGAHGMSLSLARAVSKTADGRVTFSANDDEPLLDRLTVEIRRRSDGRLMASHLLDLDERLGFDPTSTAALDTPDTTRPYLAPLPFGTRSPYQTELVIPRSWAASWTGTKFRTTVVATDIWDRTTSVAW